MAWYFRASLTMNVLLLVGTVVIIPHALGCYTSIIGFGDSTADTGNSYLNALYHHDEPFHFFFPPYGEDFFHHPTGRCCDGRLIIDFIAESLGLPLVRPYFEILNVNETVRNFEEGVNFAVVGATALDTDFLEQMGHYNEFTNFSLRIQLDWFKGMLSPLCNTTSDCGDLLSSSLVLMGPIGGNDYTHALFAGDSFQIVRTFVPVVIEAMASAINELIGHGASTLLVPGNFPIGCLPAYLTFYEGSDESEYDPSTGCLTWLNKFSEYHNEQLQIKLSQIRSLHPHANIIYGDVYSATLQLYQSPKQFGFTWEATRACCGGGGTYNYNSSAQCGLTGASACANPEESINWDGLHCTEAANRWITKALLYGNYSIPHISTSCVSQL
ncbi:GDSL esterase/lipase [Pyrus ussuriensis x Pyrus communis]|uniref:GDSL esterase/lipase n=1 Tax=Pyrus ussuriensis x Pyrus communis TaxID=2448454 RepID=A0A5N5IAX0_9ROSA|nr:GDSL esterase/lipase [Pyrus ussuriensis x Pyrus communis]